MKKLIGALVIFGLFLGACNEKNTSQSGSVPSSDAPLTDPSKNTRTGPVLEEGGWSGGGGSGVICRSEKDNSIIEFKVLDYFESSNRTFPPIAIEAYVNDSINVLEFAYPEFAQQLRYALIKTHHATTWHGVKNLEYFDDIGDKTAAINRLTYLEDGELKYYKEEQCERVQLILQKVRIDSDQEWPEVKIEKNISVFDDYNTYHLGKVARLSADGQKDAALLVEANRLLQISYLQLHEAVYYLMKAYNPQLDNSFEVRLITKHISRMLYLAYFEENSFYEDDYNYLNKLVLEATKLSQEELWTKEIPKAEVEQ